MAKKFPVFLHHSDDPPLRRPSSKIPQLIEASIPKLIPQLRPKLISTP